MRHHAPALASIVALCGLAAQSGNVPAAEPTLAPSPRLVVETTLDLGQVVRGQDASGVFALKNEGGGELKILSAKPG